ncbi:phosphatase PAP2 family protein [Streptomyces sp. NPDC047017]|uniref:phosphatase PAP2 family protein n=1 Tax=Streptomyces sp. NPDC047017 TaxID=3155024 RepID=UPI003403AF8F
MALPGVMFALLTWQVRDHGPLLRVDRSASHALLHPDRFSEVLSDLGNVQVAVPVLVVVLVYVAWRGCRERVVRWWVAPVGGAGVMVVLPAVVVPLKEWVDRAGTAAVPPGGGYFPSGHTATAVVAYGAAVLVVLPWVRTAPARRAVVAGGAVLVTAVSYGLVRRGYHWPLDVVASWCLGAVLLSLLVAVVRGVSRSRSRTSAGTAHQRSGPS